jgi:hypothetical protein
MTGVIYGARTEFYPQTPFNGCTNESCFNGGVCKNVYNNEYICACPVHYTGIKEKVQKDKQRSTKHTHKTKDRVTRTPLKSDIRILIDPLASSKLFLANRNCSFDIYQ